ncbi:hypothetical protein GS501_02520 [Saccharibacter sp. 17.LH.SD]|uniref:glycosyl hydrolase 108 family protein n=1 Tax=Saccharibacter sp. 17.LH.SD TaxID=2689393 RepID=UPI001367EA99|nr:glycosyl hydrolase 108 family protein [Saccharibacter sp. 17.LH.SD]MXV43927.1 hypothetical protein [Saccharibacter sp. 17.LH.SD]
MKTSLTETLNFTLKYEGGYSSNRADPGNWTGGRIGSGRLVGTKYGLSAPLVCRDRGLCVSSQQMKTLSEDDYRALAERYFWQPMRCNQLPAGLDALVFDHGFNTGVKTSARLLQTIVQVDTDGVIGPGTVRAIDTVRLTDVGRHCSSVMIQDLQARLECPQTGLLDAQTLSIIEQKNQRIVLICYALSSLQMADYRCKSQFKVFGSGWLERARARLKLALSLADKKCVPLLA